MAIKVFIAYASEDSEKARLLYSDLVSAGFQPWMDLEDIHPGQNWQIEIRKAIRTSDIVLACFSNRSVQKSGYVHKEYRLALGTYAERPAGSIFLIPVKFDECEIPELTIPTLNLDIRDIQWIDLWHQRAIKILINAIRLQYPNKQPENNGISKSSIKLTTTRVLLLKYHVIHIEFINDETLLTVEAPSSEPRGLLTKWDWESGRTIVQTETDYAFLYAALSPTKNVLCSTAQWGIINQWRKLAITDTDNLKVIASISRYKDFWPWSQVLISRNGKLLYIVEDQKILVYKLDSALTTLFESDPSRIIYINRPDIQCLAESPTGMVMVGFNYDNSVSYGRNDPLGRDSLSINAFNSKTGEKTQSIDLRGTIHSIVFSSCGSWLSIAGKNMLDKNGNQSSSIKLWDLKKDPALSSVAMDVPDILCNERVAHISFSPSGKMLAACGEALRVWCVASPRDACEAPTACYNLVFSHTGNVLACVGGGKITLYRIE